MELKIKEMQEIAPIEFNFEELKKELSEQLKKYTNLIYTEDTMKDAKEDRAKLNKLLKAINDRKIELKKKYLKPYEEFETKVKEILGLIDEPIKTIDSQIKNFEEKEKTQKKQDIEFFFRTRIGSLFEILKFENIFNEKWLNKTYKIEDIQNEIIEKIEKTKSDFKIIEELNTEFENPLKDYYLVCFDLSKVMQEKIRLELQKQKMEEIKKQEEIKKETKEKVTIVQESLNKGKLQSEEIQQIDFRVWVNKEQLQLLAKFFKENNIKYGKVE